MGTGVKGVRKSGPSGQGRDLVDLRRHPAFEQVAADGEGLFVGGFDAVEVAGQSAVLGDDPAFGDVGDFYTLAVRGVRHDDELPELESRP